MFNQYSNHYKENQNRNYIHDGYPKTIRKPLINARRFHNNNTGDINVDHSSADTLTYARPSVKHLANQNFGRANHIVLGAAFRHLNNNKWAYVRVSLWKREIGREANWRRKWPDESIDAARDDAPRRTALHCAGRKQNALIDSFCVSFMPTLGEFNGRLHAMPLNRNVISRACTSIGGIARSRNS